MNRPPSLFRAGPFGASLVAAPKLVREICGVCNGAGGFKTADGGRACTACNGKGWVVVEDTR